MDEERDTPIPAARARDIVHLAANPWAWPFEVLFFIVVAHFAGALTSERAVTMRAFFEGVLTTLLALPSNPVFQLGFIVFAVVAFYKAVKDTGRKANDAYRVEQAHRERALAEVRALLNEAMALPSALALRGERFRDFAVAEDRLSVLMGSFNALKERMIRLKDGPEKTPEADWRRTIMDAQELVRVLAQPPAVAVERPNLAWPPKPRLETTFDPGPKEVVFNPKENAPAVEYLDTLLTLIDSGIAPYRDFIYEAKEDLKRLDALCEGYANAFAQLEKPQND